MIKVICLSGGMNSVSLLHQQARIKDNTTDLYAVGFDYGQQNIRELESAAREAKRVQVPFIILDIPLTHLADFPVGIFSQLVNVPNISMIMAAIAASYAQALCIKANMTRAMLFMGYTKDNRYFKDTAQWYHKIQHLIRLSTDEKVLLTFPYMNESKAEVFDFSGELNINLDMAHSCDYNNDIHCGSCQGCASRIKAVVQCNKYPDYARYDFKGWQYTLEKLSSQHIIFDRNSVKNLFPMLIGENYYTCHQ